MYSYQLKRRQVEEVGFTILENVLSQDQLQLILRAIDDADSCQPGFRKTKDLFAIRRFLKEVPQALSLIFTEKMKTIIDEVFGKGYSVVKSIYFDKPAASNWFVAYHQDLTISVARKIETEGFGPWSVKPEQYAVQPPVKMLEDNFTIRIHLDDTDENNGALRVIPGSHLRGICRPETIDWTKETEMSCSVSKGGIMVMRPLLLHASSRTINSKKRRVIHIEFSRQPLPYSLSWAELLSIGE